MCERVLIVYCFHGMGYRIGKVEHDDDAVGAAVVGAGYGPVALLSGSVPLRGCGGKGTICSFTSLRSTVSVLNLYVGKY